MYNTEKARRMLRIKMMEEVSMNVPMQERILFKDLVNQYKQNKNRNQLQELVRMLLLTNNKQDAELIINQAIELTTDEQVLVNEYIRSIPDKTFLK